MTDSPDTPTDDDTTGSPEGDPVGKNRPVVRQSTDRSGADSPDTPTVPDELVQAVPVMRVPISLPCNVPVVPGTPDCSAPIEQRTEWCAVDAFWMVGRAMMCSLHFREVFPDLFDDFGADVPADELCPWESMHRYDQDLAIPEWERAR